MKASFFQRLGAYLIDYLIIVFIFSLLTINLQNNKIEELKKGYDNVYEKYTSNKISSSEYLEEYLDITYEIQDLSVVTNIINTLLIFVYFVLFQYLNKGQTIGKKIFKLRIKQENKKGVTLIQMLLRGVIIYGLISGFINILLLFNISKNVYMTIYLGIGAIETILLILTIAFILYRNDKRGLHDIITKTIVVKE